MARKKNPQNNRAAKGEPHHSEGPLYLLLAHECTGEHLKTTGFHNNVEQDFTLLQSKLNYVVSLNSTELH